MPDLNRPSDMRLEFRENEVELSYFKGFPPKKECIVLKPDDIIEVELSQDVYRSAGKAAAGAIVGGLLTGGIGLLVGAALGGKRRTGNRLCVSANIGGAKTQLVLTSKDNIQKIYNEFNKLVAKRSLKPDAGGGDVISKLKGLHELKENGTITQEEFETQKKKILG